MTQEIFSIKGLAGKAKLQGRIDIGGAKNEILKIMAASLLCQGKIVIDNAPDIDDVRKMTAILADLGINIVSQPLKHQLLLSNTSPTKHRFNLSEQRAKELRASIVLTGPLLARYGQVIFPHPGGCVIGKRPIDIFLDSFQRLGAKLSQRQGQYCLTAPAKGLQGAKIFFKQASVTATETMMLAATLCHGDSVLKNCAQEPEINSLGNFLKKLGVKINGQGTSTITITGRAGQPLRARNLHHRIIPDRIEAGSFLILGALAANDLLVDNCCPEHLDAVLETLDNIGVAFEVNQHSIRISAKNRQRYRATDLKTREYPGFPTDLQAPLAVLLTQARGQSFIFETIFEGRLQYLEALNRLGAKTRILDVHRAIIEGPSPLEGKTLTSPDLRAGLAYILAATIAKGESSIHNVEYVDRGYERIEQRLHSLGLNISRQQAVD